MLMKKRLTAALLIFFMTAVPAWAGAAETHKNLGVSLAVFLTQMGVAYGRVKWGYSPDRLDSDLLKTPEGNYVAEFNSSIALFINMTQDGRLVKNAALSFLLAPRETEENGNPDLPDGEEQYIGVCTQLILASNLNMDIRKAKTILTDLGVYGPVLDGRQRHVREGRHVYIMKLHKTGAVILVVSTL